MPHGSPREKLLQVRLDDTDLERLDLLRAAHETSRSEVIRMLIQWEAARLDMADPIHNIEDDDDEEVSAEEADTIQVNKAAAVARDMARVQRYAAAKKAAQRARADERAAVVARIRANTSAKSGPASKRSGRAR